LCRDLPLSEAKKEAAREIKAGDMGAPGTPGVEAPPFRKRKKHWMMEIHVDLLAP
jgi:hypothetical protein